MKRVEKRRLNKSAVKLIALGSVLVLLLAAYFTVGAIINNEKKEEEKKVLPEIDSSLGEAYYLNVPVAYPIVEESRITYFLVKNRDKNGELRAFDLTRVNGSFILSYDSGDGTQNMIPYIPNIVGEEGDFDYTSLYAMENNDGYGKIYLLTYLCSAVGTPYFTEKIELPNTKEERDIMLRRYGLTGSEASYVAFEYTEGTGESAEKKTHMITIGDRALSGSGFYYMVDERNVVYYTGSNYLEYALRGFEEFVRGTLVAEGIESDGAFEPYLTTDYKQWVNTEHKEEGERISQGSTVIANGSTQLPLYEGIDYVPDDGAPTDGYEYEANQTFVFDPEALKEHSDFERFYKMLLGKSVGKYYDSATDSGYLYATLIDELVSSSTKVIDFSESDSHTYKYSIIGIESVITEDEEIVDSSRLDGGVVGEHNLIKVAYYYYIDGEAQNSLTRHAVLDLSSPVLPADAVAEIRSRGIGIFDTGTNVTLEIQYTEENALKVRESLVITAISAIYNREGAVIDKVEADSYVTVRYYEIIDGERTSTKEVNLDVSAFDNSSRWGNLKEKVVGKEIGNNLEISLYENTYYYEVMRDFVCYRIKEVTEFITRELVASFRFKNASERDPFYGESYYENTLIENTGNNKYSVYGINFTACENVVKALGGIGENGTVTSAGLKGETVAVGLTHGNMVKYGLYAYTVYFELPRGLYDITEGTEADDGDVLSDYDWYDTLGFTLYISKPDEHGYRYVGSDQYDLIARIDAETLGFLEFSFAELWARKNILIMDIKNVSEIKLDLDLEDVYGDYTVQVNSDTWYLGYEDGKSVARPVYFEGAEKIQRYYANIISSGELSDSYYKQLIERDGKNVMGVGAIYNERYNGGEEYLSPKSVDTVGVTNFKNFYELLLLTTYQGILTDEERAAAFSTDRLLRLSVKVRENDGSDRVGYYTYDFYRASDRKVMVAVSRTDSAGNSTTELVSDFYVSTFAFKKLVNNFTGLLNGDILDRELGYIE